jgi:hypothetical protein
VIFIIWFPFRLTHVIAQRCSLIGHFISHCSTPRSKITHRTALQECGHRSTEEPIWIAHLEQVPILGSGENPEINGCDVLVSCIVDRSTILHKLEHSEPLKHFRTELSKDLVFCPFALLFNVKATEINMIFSLPSSKTGNSAMKSDKIFEKGTPLDKTYPTFVVGGGGRPLTPDTLTWSSPICSILMFSI